MFPCYSSYENKVSVTDSVGLRDIYCLGCFEDEEKVNLVQLLLPSSKRRLEDLHPVPKGYSTKLEVLTLMVLFRSAHVSP